MRKELFLDDHEIEAVDRVSRRFHLPTPHPANPIVKPEYPWEGSSISPSTAIYDPILKKFRIWYQVYYAGPESASLGGHEDIALRDAGYRYGVGYMDSHDGVTFQKPLLGRVTHNGRDTNLAFNGFFSPSPQTCIMTPDESVPQKRYRLWVWDEAPQGAGRHSLIGMSQYVSTDGYDWKGFEWSDEWCNDPQPFCYVKQVGHYRYPYSIGPNECNGIYWDAKIQMFVNYCRAHNGSVRSIGRMQSSDGIHWSQPELVAMPDLQDPFLFQFYQAKPYRSGEFVILYVMTYAPTQGHGCEVQILASRDGLRFERVGERQPWLALGAPGSWNAGMVCATSPVLHDDRLWIYAMGAAHPHNAADPVMTIGLYHLRPDGYVSLEAEDEGSFTTRRMVWTDDELKINADAAGGEIMVEVLAGERQPKCTKNPTTFRDHYPPGIEGYRREDCIAFHGDSLDASLRFKQASLAQIKGRYVQLRFHLRKARLFSWAAC